MAGRIHAGEIGTVFSRTIKNQSGVVVDISTTTARKFIFIKPDGTRLEKTADLVTSGTDGKCQYTTESGDLDTPGIWKFQAKVTFPAGEWWTEVEEFRVWPTI